MLVTAAHTHLPSPHRHDYMHYKLNSTVQDIAWQPEVSRGGAFFIHAMNAYSF